MEETKKKYMVYDPTDSGEPKIYNSLEKAKDAAQGSISNCCNNFFSPTGDDWQEGVEDIIITQVIYKTKKVFFRELINYILEKV